MTEDEFKERLKVALAEEFKTRREYNDPEYGEKAGKMYAEIGADLLVYDLSIPEIRSIVLEYYNG